jgi:insertion element IS1 protein InsB
MQEVHRLWSFFCGFTQQQRCLWHAIDHCTGQILAYVLAPDQDAALVDHQQLLATFDLTHFYTDGWGAYLRLLEYQTPTAGKANQALGD